MSEDQSVQERIRRETVGAVHADAGDFARRKQTLNVGARVEIGAHATHHVMTGRAHGDRVFRRIEAVLRQHFAQIRKAFADAFRLQMRHRNKHVGRAGLGDFMRDRFGHDVARREFKALVVFVHEAFVLRVQQPAAFTAHGFGDEVAFGAGEVQRGRVELYEFHVLKRRARAVSHGHAVAGGHVGVGRLAVNLPNPAGRQNGDFGFDLEHLPGFGVERDESVAGLVVVQQIDGKMIFENRNVGMVADFFDQAGFNRAAGGVAQRVDDAVVRMSAFEREGDLAVLAVKGRAPFDELRDAQWAFRDEFAHGGFVAQPRAGDDRVLEMRFGFIERIERDGHAALRVKRVGLLHPALGHEQHGGALRRDNGRGNRGDSGAGDQHVGRQRRDAPQVNVDQVLFVQALLLPPFSLR